MIKDITIGQFFPGNSILHRLNPCTKLILTIMYIVMLFVCFNFYSLLLMFIVTSVLVILSRVPFITILKSLKPVLIVVIFTSILNLIYIPGKKELFTFWKITVYMEGVNTAIFMVIRIISLIIISSLLTYTTSPTDITYGIERLFYPIKFLRNKVHIIAMMMTIALRFIPTLIEEVEKITSAQKARGANLDTGNLISRAKALIPIFIPLFVTSFRRAYELAFAMECRCYNGGEGRTKMKKIKFGLIDILSCVFSLVILGGVILLNIFVERVI